MKQSQLQFPYSARRVYTAVKHVMRTCGRFSHVKCEDNVFVIRASHGMSLPSLGEKVMVKVVADGTESCLVTVESSSKFFLNFINGGANKENVQTLGDYISNEVWKQMQLDDQHDHTKIKIVAPKINFK